MKENEKTVRKNIRMGGDIAKWFEREADRMGISQSNLMVMALNKYIEDDSFADLIYERNLLELEAREKKLLENKE